LENRVGWLVGNWKWIVTWTWLIRTACSMVDSGAEFAPVQQTSTRMQLSSNPSLSLGSGHRLAPVGTGCHRAGCHRFVRVGVDPRETRSYPQSLLCDTIALNLHMSKALNPHQNVQAAACMHPEHFPSKGQFEVNWTIKLNEIAADLRLNCTKIKTFFD